MQCIPKLRCEQRAVYMSPVGDTSSSVRPYNIEKLSGKNRKCATHMFEILAPSLLLDQVWKLERHYRIMEASPRSFWLQRLS